MTALDLKGMVEAIASAVDRLEGSETRHLIAIAGPPASGKSTLAELVQQRLIADGKPCGLVPMDGFHLDNSMLAEMGALEHKGAPDTFDIAGFSKLVQALLNEDQLPIPLFDRENDRVEQNAALIEPEQRHVVVEGNYLFLNLPGWRELRELWSLGVFLRPSLGVLEDRLIQRWLDLGHTAEEAKQRTTKNDLVNAQTVLEMSDHLQIDVLL
ncbi:MAG: nucleoside/nucleotide kinase family protein [Rhodobacteraceae bacterium]|nr:nucleoside/nucleotide kinase family protein [Paracoccaceae bacterium]